MDTLERHNRVERAGVWCSSHLAWGYDLLRIYVGTLLFIKGIWFMRHEEVLATMVQRLDMPYTGIALSHFVVISHLAGGFALAIGLLTRVAAAILLPNLLGALLFVHAQERLLSQAPNLELAGLVSVMLLTFLVFGAGPLSVDGRLHRRTELPAEGGRPAMV